MPLRQLKRFTLEHTEKICSRDKVLNTSNFSISSVQFSWVAQSCPTLCNPTNCSTPGLPVHHQLPEFTQTHVHWVNDAILPSHPLSSLSLPALNLSQHQGLFKWVSSSHQVAKVLEFQLQHQSFQQTPRTDLFYDGLVGSPCSPRDSQESSPAPLIEETVFSPLYILASFVIDSVTIGAWFCLWTFYLFLLIYIFVFVSVCVIQHLD